jgi:hypothetical protein
LKEVVKKTQVETFSVPVRLKLTGEGLKQFNLYVSLSIQEGKTDKNEKVAQGEITSFSLVRFLKSDSYFQGKLKGDKK